MKIKNRQRAILVEAASLDQARDIERALALPDVRAFCLTVGALDVLPTDRARARVLGFVADFLDDKHEREAKAPETADEALRIHGVD